MTAAEARKARMEGHACERTPPARRPAGTAQTADGDLKEL
jgi:hypothetical protein